MGVMTFLLPTPLPPGAKGAVTRARFAGGYDHTLFPTTVQLDGDTLTLSKTPNESGYVSAAWPIDIVGFPVTLSATLRERPAPYRLLVELARGKVNQVRSQAAEWDMAGTPASAEALAALAAAVKAFGPAACSPHAKEADAAAAAALAAGYVAANRAVAGYAETRLAARRAGAGRPAPAWGCRLTRKPTGAAEDLFLKTFTAARLVPNWAAIEPVESRYDWDAFDELVTWADAKGLETSIGPVIDLGGPRLPKWLADWHGELPSVAAFFCDFVETAVHRYRDKVSDWLLCSGFNHAGAVGLGEDDRLRLAARLIDAARAADLDGRLVVGLTRPWGDYPNKDENSYSPLVFADTLVRSGLPVAGFELEFVAGDGPTASPFRDRLDALRLLELFGLLGVPLDVMYRHPGRAEPDDVRSTMEIGVPSGLFKGSDESSVQAAWAAGAAEFLAVVPQVRAAFWGKWHDDDADTCGLLSARGVPKPVFAEFARVRQQYLG